jgi:flagellar motor switch protein FliG
MQQNGTKQIFINGKAQIIEMMAYLTPKERENLIRQIQSRNPQLAQELADNSVCFQDLFTFSSDIMDKISRNISSSIMGVALKGSTTENQRMALSSFSRSYAEATYEVMTKNIPNQGQNITRAQNKIVELMIAMRRKKALS